jgi:hypothetical protein
MLGGDALPRQTEDRIRQLERTSGPESPETEILKNVGGFCRAIHT